MPSPRTLAVLLGPLLLAAGLASPAAAAPLPDLKVKTVRTDVTTVERGETIVVRDTVVNTGRAKARKSQVRYYLSKDRDRSGKDRLLGKRKVPALKPGKKDAGSARVSVPAATAARGWYVIACADAKSQVKESKEGNNCRATKDKVTVTAADPGVSFPMDPDPLTVGSSSLQTDRAVTVTAYSHEDTTIEATAADGTTYSLTLPAGALLGPQQITLTPVASVPGLPLSGGLVAGVQLEPHGLQLFEPASLTITSPDAGPLAQQTPFLFHEDGEDFHLYPVAAPRPGDDADVIRMDLTHFSTPGVGAGTAADRANVGEQVPARNQAQVESVIAELLRQERANQLTGGEPDPAVMEQVTTIMNQYHDQVVRPRMQAAETNEDLASEAIAMGLGWSRQMQLLGDEDNPRHAEIMERVEKILRNVMNQNWADCLEHDLSATLDLLRVARAAALWGYAWADEASDKAFGCGRFEIRFNSRIEAHSSWSGGEQTGTVDGVWHTRGTVETRMLEMNNTGPLGWVGFSYSMQNTIHDPHHPCHLSETGLSTAPGQLRAGAIPLLGSINVIEGSTTPPPVPVSTFVGLVADAKPTETYEYSSCDGSTSTSTDSRWAGHYEDFGKNWTTDPGQQAGDFIDSKTFTISDTWSGGSQVEQTTVEVWHKPKV